MTAAPLRVVTTTQDLASITQAVGGSNVSVSALVVGARDPHRIEAKPSYMARVAKADLFIAVGLELEIGYEQPILAGSRNSKVQRGQIGYLNPFEGVPILERPREAVTRAQGDVHPYGNPHYWLDPFCGRLIAKNIAQRLSKLQPSKAREFEANLAAFNRAIDDRMFGPALVSKFGGDALWQWESAGKLNESLKVKSALAQLAGWAGRMAAHRGKPIVTYHRTYSYFAHRFELRVIDELEPKPGLEPSPGHLAAVVRSAKQAGVRAVIYEPYKPERPAEFVASRIGAKAVAVPASVGHTAAAKDYLSLFDEMVARVAGALGS